eukprot:5318977-Pyramimonas_sp.AAC.1
MTEREEGSMRIREEGGVLVLVMTMVIVSVRVKTRRGDSDGMMLMMWEGVIIPAPGAQRKQKLYSGYGINNSSNSRRSSISS